MNGVQAKLLEEIMEHEENLNEWEAKFIDDLYTKDPNTLTTSQNRKLNQIYGKAVFNR